MSKPEAFCWLSGNACQSPDMKHRVGKLLLAVAVVSAAAFFVPSVYAQQAVDVSPATNAKETPSGATGENQPKPDSAPVLAPMDNAMIAAEHVAALIARARGHHAKGDYDSAREDSSEAIRLDPQNAEAFEVRGDAWVGAKRYESAIDDYDAAVRLKPDVARLFARRAVAFGLMRQFRLAVRDYTEAVRLEHSTAMLTDRAGAYKKVRRFDLAIDDESEAIRLDPNSAELYDNRGQTYARNNAYDRAIADYNEAIRLKPTASFYLNRGTSYQLKGDLDLAIADYEKAIALDDKLALAYNNRGVALREKGDRRRALADFTAAIRLDPDLEVAVAHRKALALELERIGAQMPLKHPAKTACAAGAKDCAEIVLAKGTRGRICATNYHHARTCSDELPLLACGKIVRGRTQPPATTE